MFVDTSAIVAILCGEPDAAELADGSLSRSAIHLAGRTVGSLHGACVEARYCAGAGECLVR